MPDDACIDSSSEPADQLPGAGLAGLVLVSTPIGNLGDMTFRGLEALRGAELVLCEDTRTSSRLLTHYGILARTAALHEHNEAARIPEILGRLRGGARIALISDAGTPLVSDPGYRLVRAAIAEGLPVQAAPGANAATTALVLSGLPPHPFLFYGFPPPRQAARLAAFGALRAAERAGLSATLVFYEAPHRLAETLADMAEVFGARPGAVARELTKRFEEVVRDTLPGLATHFAAQAARGEITVVVGPAPDEAPEDFGALLEQAMQTHSLREAVALVAEATQTPRRAVYRRALEMRGKDVLF
jgi:16S rRNA (cytidine1402-2'-O)-methyltransferase